MIEDSCVSDHTFFLDTGFIAKIEIPDCVWDALFRKKIVLSQAVWREVSGWRSNPRLNLRFHEQLLRRHPSIEVLPLRKVETNIEKAVEYYIQLLSVRKQAYDIAEAQLKGSGADSSIEKIRAEAQKLVGNRGMTIAKKGHKDQGKINRFFDEETLILAFCSALENGCDTSILTFDGDFIDQFVKLQYVFDTHYRSMRLSEEYHRQPLNFVHVDHAESLSAFEEIDVFSMPGAFEQSIVESLTDWVNIGVDCLNNSGQLKIAQAIYQADKDMFRLLEMKGDSGGRNTNLLGTKNLHLALCPDGKNIIPGHVAIAKDIKCQE